MEKVNSRSRCILSGTPYIQTFQRCCDTSANLALSYQTKDNGPILVVAYAASKPALQSALLNSCMSHRYTERNISQPYLRIDMQPLTLHIPFFSPLLSVRTRRHRYARLLKVKYEAELHRHLSKYSSLHEQPSSTLHLSFGPVTAVL